jgi:flagellar biosynthesis regulator FlaF
MAKDPYQKAITETATERQLEAQALIRTALRLNDALASNDPDALVEAVTINYRLWLFFYSQIESKQVVLPPEVETNIVTLVAYVVKVSPRAFAGDAAVLNTLISINRNIAAGLSEGPDMPVQAQATAGLSHAISA